MKLTTFSALRHEIRVMLQLFWPVWLAQLLTAVAGFVDTLMAGHAGVDDLAGVAVGSALWLTLLIIPMGLFMAINPIVGQYAGAGQYAAIRGFMHQAFRVAAVLSLVFWLIFICNKFYLQWILQDPAVLQVTSGYLQGFAWGVPALIMNFVLRPYSEGLSFTRPYLLASIVSLLVNIPANAILIFGMGSWPGMGGAGAGWATALAMWSGLLVMLAYTRYHRHYQQNNLYKQFSAFDIKEYRHLLQVGIPIAFTLFVEVSIFSLIALFLGGRPSSEIAAHQIAMNVSYLAFTLPLSLAFVATIRVSNHVGADCFEKARLASLAAILLAIGAALMNMTILLLAADEIAAFYTDDLLVQKLAAGLMLFAVMFQLADAFVVPTQGALRGYKDTRWPLFFAVLAYWLIALPLGYSLGLTDWLMPMMGATGFWISLVAGLTVSAVLMTARLFMLFKLKQPAVRLR